MTMQCQSSQIFDDYCAYKNIYQLDASTRRSSQAGSPRKGGAVLHVDLLYPGLGSRQHHTQLAGM